MSSNYSQNSINKIYKFFKHLPINMYKLEKGVFNRYILLNKLLHFSQAKITPHPKEQASVLPMKDT